MKRTLENYLFMICWLLAIITSRLPSNGLDITLQMSVYIQSLKKIICAIYIRINKDFFLIVLRQRMSKWITLNVLHIKNKMKWKEKVFSCVNYCVIVKETINACDLPQFVTIFSLVKSIYLWEHQRVTRLLLVIFQIIPSGSYASTNESPTDFIVCISSMYVSVIPMFVYNIISRFYWIII